MSRGTRAARNVICGELVKYYVIANGKIRSSSGVVEKNMTTRVVAENKTGMTNNNNAAAISGQVIINGNAETVAVSPTPPSDWQQQQQQQHQPSPGQTQNVMILTQDATGKEILTVADDQTINGVNVALESYCAFARKLL